MKIIVTGGERELRPGEARGDQMTRLIDAYALLREIGRRREMEAECYWVDVVEMVEEMAGVKQSDKADKGCAAEAIHVDVGREVEGGGYGETI